MFAWQVLANQIDSMEHERAVQGLNEQGQARPRWRASEGQMSADATGGQHGISRKWLKTGIFTAGMLAILAVAITVSQLDQTPTMPADDTHVVVDKFPNKTCMECHEPKSLPDSHPIEYERFACTRCHVATKQALPPGVQP
jgi:hypothetical protein